MRDDQLLRKVRQAVSLVDLKDALLAHVNLGFVAKLIDDIIRNTTWAKSIAKESYEHDNGFSKIVLVGLLGDEHELRFHLWDGRAVPPSNIHNHTRDYVSIILSGRFMHQEFVHTEYGELYYRYKVGTRTDTGCYDLQFVGEEPLSKLSERKLETGMYHAAALHVLHRIVMPEASPVVTLFCQGARKRSETDMFCRKPLIGGSYKASSFNAPQLIAKLQKILKLLEL